MQAITPYQKHVKQWQYCQRCPLGSVRNRIVLARGKIPADIIFLGEAPGDSEDVLGIPFCGPAGHLLDDIIRQTIPPNLRLLFSNLVACFPREQKEAGINEPPKEAIEACMPRVHDLLAIAKPKLLILVGQLAEKWEAKRIKWTGPKAGIIHPAAILRMDISQKGLAIQRAAVQLSEAVQSTFAAPG